MTQSIALVTMFLKLVDSVYKQQSKTAILDAMTEAPSFLNANEVKVMKLSTVGLGNYSRTTGYPAGDITAAWETMQLSIERGRAFTLDRMDNEESLGLVLGNLITEWMRVHVAPELDAVRFAKYAADAGNVVGSPTTLSAAADVLAAIDAGNLALSEDEVPEEGRKLYITHTLNELLKGAMTRTWGNDQSLNRAVKFPQVRVMAPFKSSLRVWVT